LNYKLVEDIQRGETELWELEQLRMRRAAYRTPAVTARIEQLRDDLATLRSWLR
jgi:hypothetical protein